MQYIYVNDDFSVGAILCGEDPAFPGVPVEERFSADFLAKCVQVSDDTVIENGAKYDPESGTFYVPEPPAPPSVDEKPEQPVNPDAGESQRTYAEKLANLEKENKLLKEQVSAQADQAEFYEDCIAEMAAVVYA